MALPSGFRERLEQMEQSRNQRLSLLQAEKEVQANKSKVLASKISNIRSADHRCLKLEQKIVSQHLLISSLKSEIDLLDSNYLTNLQQFRVLKYEVEELEELKKEKEMYFASKTREMEDFNAQVENFAVGCRMHVEKLKNHMEELKSSFVKLQGNIRPSDNSDLAAAEMRKSELLAEKDNLDRMLASNYQRRAQLQKQLQSILMTQSQEGRKLCHPTQKRCLKQKT